MFNLSWMLASVKKVRPRGCSVRTQYTEWPYNSSLINIIHHILIQFSLGVGYRTNIRSWNLFCKKNPEVPKLLVPQFFQSLDQLGDTIVIDFIILCARAAPEGSLSLKSDIQNAQLQEASLLSQFVCYTRVHSSVDWTVLQFSSMTIHSFEFRRPEKWDVSLLINYCISTKSLC